MTAFYAAFSIGYLPADPGIRFDVAEAFLRHGHFAIPHARINTITYAGENFSIFFPGQSLVFFPFATLGVWAAKLAGISPDLSSTAAKFLAALIVAPLAAALAVVGHTAVLRRLGVRRRPALASGLALAVATSLWVYAGRGSEEPILAALGIWALWAVLGARGELARPEGPILENVVNRLGLASVLLVVGLLHRATFISVVLCVMLVVVPQERVLRAIPTAHWPRRPLVVWTAAVTGLAAILPLYNWARFGDVFTTGYELYYQNFGGAFSTPLHLGLLGHLFSPGKSIFLYMPWLLLLLPAMASSAVRSRLGPLLWGWLIMITVHFWFYCRFIFWGGDSGSWGVRFHISLLPVLTVPIGLWLGTLRAGRWRRRTVLALALCSVAVQLMGTILVIHLEHVQAPQYYTGPLNQVPAASAWTWQGSHLRRRAVNVWDKLNGRELLHPDQLSGPSALSATSWNVFPIRGSALIPKRVVGLGLWLIWLLLATTTVCTGARWWRLASRLPPDG